jgi:hypothetical protein
MSETPDLNTAEPLITPWEWLKPHVQSGAALLIRSDLDLEKAAKEIAEDSSAEVKAWIASGAITRPTLEQIALWDQEPHREFRFVIIQPFVLIQA